MSRNGLCLAAAFGAATFTVIFGALAAGPGAAAADPAEAGPEVPATRYESEFKGYRRFEDQPVASWRGSNELVHKLGGWKAFASGKVPEIPAKGGDAAPAKPPAPHQAPAAEGSHSGHMPR